MKKISIFGLGYVGCVSMACLAKDGHNVIGVDLKDFKIEMINKGKPTIVEKDIGRLIFEQSEKGRISATKDYKYAVKRTDISIICVGTPSTDQGHLSLKAVYETAEHIAHGLKDKDDFHVIVIRSTVMPGTNRKVGAIIEEFSGKKRNVHFAVVTNPEFMREGTSIKDYYKPPYIVLGSENKKALRIMRDLYKNICAPLEETEIEIAEFVKYVSNSFHALKVTFANEIGNICKKLNIDSHKLMDLFCKDTHLNISKYYLRPGFSYGGSCLPKDLRALKTLAHDLYLKSPVLDSIEISNENQIKNVFDMIVSKGKRNVGILGLSFKKGTDDLRESPAVELTERLIGKGYKILIYDDNVNLSKLIGANKEYIEMHIPHISSLISNDFDYVVSNSELLIISNDAEKFRNVEKVFPGKQVIDLIRISDTQTNGNYEGISW